MLKEKVISKELKSCIVSLIGDDIIEFAVKEGCEVELTDVKEMVLTAGELGGGKMFKNLIIAGEYSSMTSEATQYMKSDEAHRYTIADAIVIDSLAQRILGNFYLGIVNKKRPSKLFNSKEKALGWLKSLN